MKNQLLTRAVTGAAVALAAVCGVLSTGCGAEAPQAGGPPPTAVEFVNLERVPIERATEYIVTLRSRRSATLQPMVEGPITKIFAKSGAQLRAGDPILEIDDSRQRAAIASLESLRIAAEADLAYARSEAERQRSLFATGAASAREAEQAQTSSETAEAQLRSIEEQLREQRVQLAYYRVTAPTAGVVGDVPVRIGDRVSTSTPLTTIDGGGDLELYLRVPIQSAHELKPGLPVRIVDDAGRELAATEIDFVSPQVDEATQTVLAKALLANTGDFRTEQQVRARVIWSESPGLRIPVVAVSRVSGQSFAYVVEDGAAGPVARQRSLQLGPIAGNDYLVLDGLTEGDRLIVSGVQKVRDGGAVDPKLKTANDLG